MIITRKLLDAENSTQIAADHSLDLALIVLGFTILILIAAWRWRAVLFREWIRSFNSGAYLASAPPPPPGLKNAALQLLPSATYTAEVARDIKDCAICLVEFSDGDLTRALPQCGHLFHVVCVDKWLKSHSSCPSCRQLVTVFSNSSATAASQKA
ncbi:hypothetical protein RND81_09G160600 [Saponaria officinalis]|uniref:RING-type domain-containing protein n=1 Tax=Saponaria officinalis TaxID=3572 RepID=A0AAW1IMB4_SAPOF